MSQCSAACFPLQRDMDVARRLTHLIHHNLRLHHLRSSQQCLPDLHIRHRIRLTLGRKRPIRGPQVNQRLHGLQLVRLQQVQRRRRQDEMAEAAVELLLQIQMIERVDKMRVVEMRIDAEHLQKDGLADAAKVLGEAGALAEPVGFAAAGGGGRRRRRGEGRVDGVRDARGVGGEDLGVVDLARDPALHERDVLVGRQLHGLVAAVEPGVGVVAGKSLVSPPKAGTLCEGVVWKVGRHSRAGAHLRTCRGVADARAFVLLLINHADEVPQVPVVLDTLVRYPLTGLYRLGPRDERHEVAFDNVLGVGWIDPRREGLWEVVRGENLIVLRRHDGFGEGIRLGQGRQNAVPRPSAVLWKWWRCR